MSLNHHSRRSTLQLARRLMGHSSIAVVYPPRNLIAHCSNVGGGRIASTGSWRLLPQSTISGRVRSRSVFENCCHRYYSSPTSNTFWRDLNLAVGEGDGDGAEAIVMGLLKTYTNEDDENTGSNSKLLDTRIFSLVLQAWKNSRSELAAERAQQLLDQMIALYEEGILREPPASQDYNAVLECWVASGDSSLHAVESSLRIMKRFALDHHNNRIPLPPDGRSCELLLQILARGGHASRAMKFMETSVPKPYSITMYNWILQAYLNSNLPDAPQMAHRLLEFMVQKSGTSNDYPEPTGASYDVVLQCWARVPDHPGALESAQRLLANMKQKKLQITLESYQSVISILAAKGEAVSAEQLLEQLVQEYSAQFDAQLKPTLVPFETVLLAYTKCHRSDSAPRAESLLMQMLELHHSGILERPPDAWSYNFVLKCWMHSTYSDAKDQALNLVEKMRGDGVSCDTSTMNTLLNIIATREGPDQAEEYLNQMYQAYLEDPIRNPQPDVISFGTVLKAWASMKAPVSADRAQALLLRIQKLHESGWSHCRPDVAIFASAMKCYSFSKSNDAPYMAEDLLRSMQEFAKEDPDMKPDIVCWNTAIQGWAQVGDGPRAEALFQEMLQMYLSDRAEAAAPNVITFSAVLSAWARTQRNQDAPGRAETLLQQMKHLSETGILPNAKPNVISYSIVLDCLAYARSPSAALRAESILREMKASDDPNVQPNVVSYNSVIKAWSFSRDPNALSKVTTLLKEIICLSENDGNKKFAPNVNTFGSVLKVLADSDVPDKEARAHVVLKLMERFGVVLNDWGRDQLRRCSDERTKNGGRGRFRRSRKVETTDKVPDVPDLNYS